MVAPPAQAPIGIITYSAAIEERIAGLEAELARYREAYNELSESYNQLSQKETFRDCLFAVSPGTLTISHKASIDATVRYLQAHERDRDERGYIKMDAYACAGMAGQSYGTLLTNWGVTSRELRIHDGDEVQTDIGNVPVFDRLVVRIKTDDRERYPQGYYLETYMKERDILLHPDQYKAGTPIEWGGKRKDAGRRKCKHCDVWMRAQDHIRTAQREHICPKCHRHEWDEVRTVSDDVPPTPDNDEPINEPVEGPEASKNQVDFCSPEGLDDAEIEASKPPLDEVYPSPLLRQVESSPLVSINTPPCPEPQAPFDPDVIYTEWLQRQHGQGQIIYATGRVNASDKYKSEEVGYSPKIDAYLRGDLDHIYGSNPLFEDGSTYFLWFDFDEKQPEHDAHYKEYMAQLAAGGVASLYFPRRPGRGHFGIALNARVDAQAAYDFVIALCPALATVNECFPIGDKVKQRISWPFFQRIGDQVQACRCIAMMPSGVLLRSDGIVANRRGLARILDAALTPASLVAAFVLRRPSPPEAPPDVGGVLLDSPLPCSSNEDTDDFAPVVCAEMNNALSWQEAAGFDNPIRNGRFRATWRKEDTASVVIDKDGEHATDYGRADKRLKKLDRYEVYCLTHRIDKTEDLKQRIRKRRQALQVLRRAS